MWSLKQNVSGLLFVKPNISALKYGRDMEIEAANTCNVSNTDIKLSECGMIVTICGLFETLPYAGASPE